MQLDYTAIQKFMSKDLMDFTIRVGLIVFMVIICLQIFAPFLGIMLWALILAVTLYPLHKKAAKRLGGKQGKAATLLVLSGLLIIGIPTVMLGGVLADHITDLHSAYKNNEVIIKQPDPSVAEWPIIGKKVYSAWSNIAEDLPEVMRDNSETLTSFFKTMLAMIGGLLVGILKFLGSLAIAGIMMAYGESGNAAMLHITNRMVGTKNGPRLHKLSTATIRSVATGVIGVAFIQALLLGIGFVWADIPAAGVLALIALLLGIVQVPAAVIFIPVVAYLWSAGDASTTYNIIYTIYFVIAGLSDNVLKPLLLGRGVEAPMPIILLGALGGMVHSGLIGLFIGAVLLALGYQLFNEWVAGNSQDTDDASTNDTPLPQESV
jgi:predicted PurR-regulated permease PerM